MLVRRIDFEAIALQRQGELGIWASLLGQEAAQVGSGRALGPRDMAFPTYREHGVAWCRGLDPAKLLELFRGVSHGGWDPKAHNFHLYTIVIGAQTLHATGYAMGIQRDGAVGEDGEAAIAYFGDGATSQGDVNEAFIWASVTNAPVVFFCQNNQWAISEPLDRQTRIPLYQRAPGFGFPGLRVDGNDVLRLPGGHAQGAMQAAREGQGPTLIEAYTYRMGAHTTTDDPTRYRLSAELESWKLKDPIERVKQYLIRSGLAQERLLRRDQRRSRRGRHRRAGNRAWRCPTPIRFDVRQHLYRPNALLAAGAGTARQLPQLVRRGGRAMTTLTLSRALNEGLRKAMENDPKVLIMGEDVGKLGGVFRVTDGLQKDFGEDRVIDTPLAESGIIGTAIGLALRGYRPVCEIQFDGFVFPAFDQIVSQLAKMAYRSLGKLRLPVTVRIPFGGGIGAVEHHSESPEALFVHTSLACGSWPAATRPTPTR